MKDETYGAPESWYGTYYELAVQMSAEPNDAALGAALAALWSAPCLIAGPWLDRTATDSVVTPHIVEPEGMSSLYGVLSIPPLGHVRCVSWVLREIGRKADWIDVSIPTSALEAFGLAYPVHDSPQQLLQIIDRTLLTVAAHLYTHIPFVLGLIGEEVSGYWSASSITPDAIEHGGVLLPAPLVKQLDAENVVHHVTSDLFWIPRVKSPAA